MVFKESRLSVLDNSGAKEVLCIRVLNANPERGVGFPGFRLVTTIKLAIPKKFKKKRKILKKGEIHQALLVSTRKAFMRKTGHRIGGSGNLVVMLRRDRGIMPFANRLRGPIFREVRGAEYSKIIIMASNLL